MKKVLFILVVATISLVSCNKELVKETTNPTNINDGAVTLFVSAPKLLDADTKASISESNGSFSWKAGDEIAVKNTNGDTYKFIAQGSGDNVFFSCSDGVSGTLSTVYYPYNTKGATALPTEISGLNGALAANAIRLSGTIDENNSVSMNYSNAFLKLTFNNVPTFASAVQFYEEGGNSVKVTFDKLTEKGTITAYVPVNTGTINITAQLLDDSNNVIISKYGENKEFTAGTLKRMKALEVGKVITFTNNNSATWTTPRVSIWNGSNNFGFSSTAANESATYPWKLNSYPNVQNKYYIVLNSDISWISSVDNIGVWFGSGNDGCQTDCVYLYRDIDFTIPNGGGMWTNYRIYWNNSTMGWTTIKAYVWDTSGNKLNGAWPGTDATKYSDNIYYYQFDDDSYYGKTVYIIFNNGSAQTGNISVTLNKDFIYSE